MKIGIGVQGFEKAPELCLGEFVRNRKRAVTPIPISIHFFTPQSLLSPSLPLDRHHRVQAVFQERQLGHQPAEILQHLVRGAGRTERPLPGRPGRAVQAARTSLPSAKPRTCRRRDMNDE